MNSKLFQNDNITGNSKIGFELRGNFKEDENILIEELKQILNREILFSNIEYKLLEPTDSHVALIKDGNYYIIKTPMYSYFEAMFVIPKFIEFSKKMKDYKNSHLYFKIGFNDNFIDLNQINVLKFILEFNEDYILKNITDITKNNDIEKLKDIKPETINNCSDSIQKQAESLKFDKEDDLYGIDFTTLKLGYITFKYIREVNYRNKWKEIMTSLNHTIITLYNTSNNSVFTDEESNEIEQYNKDNKEIEKSFDCYLTFHEKYKSIKLTSDLNTDSSLIDVIFPYIKDKLFDIVIKNGIKQAEVNYDTDISKLQLKNLELKKCFHLSGVDIVDSEIENCFIKDCDIYDTKIKNSNISKCNIFGYGNCNDSKLINCFVSRNINLKDCSVSGQLGKMCGVMKGGSLKDTILVVSMAEIDDKVEKDNVNEIQ